MGSSKGYGFVTFATDEEARSIIEKVQITIKGRKLNIAPAIKKQVNQSDSCSTEMSSVESQPEIPSVVSLHEISRNQSRDNFLRRMDSSGSTINWNMPYLYDPSGYLAATHLNANNHSSGDVQVNCVLPYPTLVYVPQYPYQQTAGFTYATYGSFPDMMPLIPVPIPDFNITAETQ